MKEDKKLLETWYRKVKPFVKKIKKRYPKELNIEGLEPALTSDIAEIAYHFYREGREDYSKIVGIVLDKIEP